ncbi:MAG: molybdate ABC transporter substrate-binding protein [Campylobacterales bacterium]
MKTLLLSLLAALSLYASEITVAAAASYRNALEELITHYDNKVNLIFNASGKFYHQIEQGAPFDVFMAADMKYPQEAVKNGYAAGEAIPTVENRLILWSRTIDVSKGMKVLQDKKVKKIAIANPKTAPLGERAVESLKYAKIYETIESKLVYGESISQATHFVESGAAEVGITGFSVVANIINEGKGQYFMLDPKSHKSMIYGTVVLKNSKQPEAAKRFVAFLKSPKAAEVFKKHGLTVIP